MFALSLTIYAIITNQINAKSLILKVEVKVKVKVKVEEEKRTCVIQLEIVYSYIPDFFQNFSYVGT